MINNMLPSISSILLAAVEVAVVMVLGLYVFYKAIRIHLYWIYRRREEWIIQDIISVDQVSMRFALASEKVDSLKEYFIKTLKSADALQMSSGH